jgi:translation elongation factor EF-4
MDNRPGGQASRCKRELLAKQNEGKKRMRQFGKSTCCNPPFAAFRMGDA